MEGLVINMKNLCFSVDDRCPEGWQGNEPLVIQACIRSSAIHKLYVDTGCSTEKKYTNTDLYNYLKNGRHTFAHQQED